VQAAEDVFFALGMLDIPATLLAGPEGTIAHMRGLTLDDVLLNNVWTEGGVFLDADERRLLIWGGVRIDTHPSLRCLFAPLIRPLWPSWFVERAGEDAVEYVSLPIRKVPHCSA
jgi:hypothetical protein